MKMWSGRFRQPLDPEFEKWQRSFPYDCRLLPFELAASRAHANALKSAGVLSSAELSEILKGLETISRRAESSAEFLKDDEAEDVHHFVEKQLAGLIGDVGYKLHTGRSRNEQIATDLRLFVRQSIDALNVLIGEWVEAILVRAESAGSASMPSYTHLQPAEPVLVAHWLLAYLEMFLRDVSRLADCRKRANLCPLGSGAVAGATLAIDRQAMAVELGFDGPTANSIDATCDRDFAIEFVDALSLVALHLSRWAEEMILLDACLWICRVAGGVLDGQQRHAAEKKSRLAGVGARESGASNGMRYHVAKFDQGPAAGLQQRFTGNAGGSFRCL